jgi:UDP-N-acetylmuramoylalanine--D-glutamate ligase
VLGLARSGAAAARLLARLGAEVVGYDRDPQQGGGIEGLAARLGGPSLPSFEGFDRVIQSPGVPASAHPCLVPEVDLAAEHISRPLLGITGTNGKSTTTVLATEMLRRGGIDAASGGNLGTPLCDLVDVPADVVVAELSSFQLEHARRLRASIAVLLNLAPDHLDRHGTLEAYGAAKARLAELQRPDDLLVYNADDPWACATAERSRARRLPFSARRRLRSGGFLEGGTFVVGQGAATLRVPIERLSPAARSPVDNALAAACAALAAGASPEGVVGALESFEGLPHRARLVCARGGVRYVNDSKATNPAAAARSLEACDGAVVWLAGGRNKGLDLAPLRDAVRKVRVAAFYGEASGELARSLEGACAGLRAHTLDEAFARAVERAAPGDTVLLAPACASQDQFTSFEERGARFAELALKLPDEEREVRP